MRHGVGGDEKVRHEVLAGATCFAVLLEGAPGEVSCSRCDGVVGDGKTGEQGQQFRFISSGGS